MIFQILLFVLLAGVEPPKISLDQQGSQNKEYIISSTTKPFINSLFISSYPFIKTKLTDPQYPLVYYGEMFRKLIHQYDSFSYAKKRMTELFDSRNDIRLGRFIQNTDDDPKLVITSLKNWWYNQQPSLTKARFVGPYDTWEAGLARYVIDIDDYMSLLEKNRNEYYEDLIIKKIRLRLEIVEDQKNLLNIITTKKNPKAEREYLTNLARNVFQYLLQKPTLVNNNIDFNHLFFDFATITNDQEYGLYDAYIDPTELPINETMSFSNGNYKYPNILVNNTIVSNYTINFHTILVDDNTNEVMLNLSQNTSIPLSHWLETDQFEKGEWIHRYTYTFNVPENIRTNDYLFSLKKTANKNITYQSSMNVTQINKIQYGVDKKNNIKTVSLIDEKLPAIPDTMLFQRMMQFDKAALPNQIDFTIDTSQTLDPSDLDNIVLILTPIYQPTLSLIKRSPLPNTNPELFISRNSLYRFDASGKNITKKMSETIQKQLGATWWLLPKSDNKDSLYLAHIFFIPQLLSFFSFITLFLLTFVLFFRHKIAQFGSHSKKMIVKNLFLTHHILQQIATKFSLIFLCIVISALFIDVIFIKERYELVIACILIFWILAIDGMSIEGTINFVIAGIFFAIQIIFMTAKSLDIAEKSAGWTYIFLIFGFLHIVFQKLFRTDKLYPHYDFYSQFKFQVKNRFSRLYWICALCGNLILRFIDYVYFILTRIISLLFVLVPKTKKDWARNIIVLLLLIMICTVLSISSFSAIQYVRREFAKKEAIRVRLSRNPTIIKIEPRLVYYSTNVILRGKGFGWQESDNSRLMTQYGEVGTKLWTDTKIIFSVPLHWKPGNIRLKIAKPIIWNGKKQIAESTIEQIRLIPRSDTFTDIDDAYFDQLKTLDKETLQINGYTNEH